MTPKALNKYLIYYNNNKGRFRKHFNKDAKAIVELQLLRFRNSESDDISNDLIETIIKKYMTESLESLELQPFYKEDLLLYEPVDETINVSLSQSILITLNKIIQKEAPENTVVIGSLKMSLIDLNNNETKVFTSSGDCNTPNELLRGTATIICPGITSCIVTVLHDTKSNKLFVTHVLAAELSYYPDENDVKNSGIVLPFNVSDDSLKETNIDAYFLGADGLEKSIFAGYVKKAADASNCSLNIKTIAFSYSDDAPIEFMIMPSSNNKLTIVKKIQNASSCEVASIELANSPSFDPNYRP